MIRVIHPAEAKRLVDEEHAVVVDIREPEEFAREHIEGARLAPLSVLPSLAADPDTARPAVFHCQSGRRTENNAALLEQRGFSVAYMLEGGLEGWKKAGLPVIRHKTPLPMPRQIQLAAGGLVFASTLLSFAVPAFSWLTLFVGAGLMFAGYTGFCAMAKVLARMPWNRV